MKRGGKINRKLKGSGDKIDMKRQKRFITGITVVCLMMFLILIVNKSPHSNEGQIKAVGETSESSVVKEGVKIDATLSDYPTIGDIPFSALDGEGELNGYRRMEKNEYIPVKTTMMDGRRYFIGFGPLSNGRHIDSTAAMPDMDDFGLPLPLDSQNPNDVYQVNVQRPLPWKSATVPIFGPQLALMPKPIDDRQYWTTYAFDGGKEMGHKFPSGAQEDVGSSFEFGAQDSMGNFSGITRESGTILKMYTNEKEVIAYSILVNQETKIVTALIKATVSPVGTKGRIKTTYKYLKVDSQVQKIALAYGLHVDIQKQHTKSELFSLGDYQGIYFNQNDLSDKQPYFLQFHMDGYKNQPTTEYLTNNFGTSIWKGKVSNLPDPVSTPEIGKGNKYNLSHPTLGLRWDSVELQPLESTAWSLDQSVTVSIAEEEEFEKTAENLTSGNIDITNVNDEIEYSVSLKNKTVITNGSIKDTLPAEVSKPTEIILDNADGSSTILDSSKVYDEATHTITLSNMKFDPKQTVLRYSVTILPSASEKTIINTATLNGIDADEDPLEEVTASVEIDVFKEPDPFTAPIAHGDDQIPAPNLEDEFVEYRVDLDIPLRNDKTTYPKVFKLTNNFENDVLALTDPSKTRIVTDKNVDVTNLFTTVIKDGKIVTELISPASGGEDIYGHTVYIDYRFNAKDGVDLIPYLSEGYYHFKFDVDFQYSPKDAPLKSNVADGTLPGPLGQATAYYQDEKSQEITGYPAIKQSGKVGLDTFTFNELAIPNYEVLKVEGAVTGKFELAPIETKFIYRSTVFGLRQTVKRTDGSSASEANLGETLHHQVDVNSAFSSETPKVYYQTLILTEPLDSNLESPTELSLQLTNGKEVGEVSYDPVRHLVTAKLSEADQVARSEDVHLVYQAKISIETPLGTEMKAKATASGSYSNGNEVKTQESNEVVSKVTKGILIFESAPKKLSFGEPVKISSKEQVYPLQTINGDDLSVKDLRGIGEKWSLTAKMTKLLTHTKGKQLPESMYYRYNGNEQLMGLEESALIRDETTTSRNSIIVSDDWVHTITQPFVKTKAGQVQKGTYQGTIQWTLQDVPSRE